MLTQKRHSVPCKLTFLLLLQLPLLEEVGSNLRLTPTEGPPLNSVYRFDLIEEEWDVSVVSVRTTVFPAITVALCDARGEFEPSESRQYTTPVWLTCILGVHPMTLFRQQHVNKSVLKFYTVSLNKHYKLCLPSVDVNPSRILLQVGSYTLCSTILLKTSSVRTFQKEGKVRDKCSHWQIYWITPVDTSISRICHPLKPLFCAPIFRNLHFLDFTSCFARSSVIVNANVSCIKLSLFDERQNEMNLSS